MVKGDAARGTSYIGHNGRRHSRPKAADSLVIVRLRTILLLPNVPQLPGFRRKPIFSGSALSTKIVTGVLREGCLP
jgi:hypothetical protein